MMHNMPFEQAQRTIAHRLFLWAGLSVILGAILARLRPSFWRGISVQFIFWGIIDGIVALLAGKTNRVLPINNIIHPIDQENQIKTKKLARLLWVNTVLDIFYMIGGLRLSMSKGASSPFWRGQGVGIIIQGGFLFVFDLVHAKWLSNRSL